MVARHYRRPERLGPCQRSCRTPGRRSRHRQRPLPVGRRCADAFGWERLWHGRRPDRLHRPDPRHGQGDHGRHVRGVSRCRGQGRFKRGREGQDDFLSVESHRREPGRHRRRFRQGRQERHRRRILRAGGDLGAEGTPLRCARCHGRPRRGYRHAPRPGDPRGERCGQPAGAHRRTEFHRTQHALLRRRQNTRGHQHRPGLLRRRRD